MATTYSQSEAAALFVQEMTAIVAAAASAPGPTTTLERCQAVATGIAGMIAGDNDEVPLFILAPHPDPETVAYQLALGFDYWPVGDLAEGVDLAAVLLSAWVESL